MALDPEGGETATAPLVSDAYTSLMTAIVEGRLGAGTALSQNKLAAHLGVSRTPVREALLRLEREGLVYRRPDSGFIVSSITPEEVEEACDLLEVLDLFVYQRAARRLDVAGLDRLRSLAETLVASVAAGDAAGWKQADQQYHRIVNEAAHNRFAAESVTAVRRRVQRFWLQEPRFDDRLRTCAQDHVALAEAMADQDDASLRRTVHEHIERMRASVLSSLASLTPLLPAPDPLAAVGRRDAV